MRINLKAYGTATLWSDYSWTDFIQIYAGERSGTTILNHLHDSAVEGDEYIIIRPESVPQEAYPSPGAAVYSLTALRITIIADGPAGASRQHPAH